MAARRKRAGRAASLKRKRASAGRGEPFLSRNQQRDILALALLGLALLILLALAPVELLGGRGEAWFPSGNAVGRAGTAIREVAGGALGIAAFAVPVLLVLGGARVSEWMRAQSCVRGAVLTTGLATIASCTAFLLEWSGGSGWLGAVVGGGLRSVFGWLGASLLLLIGLLGLFVITLDWNPLRWSGRGLRQMISTFGGAIRRVARARGGQRPRASRGQPRKRPKTKPGAGTASPGAEHETDKPDEAAEAPQRDEADDAERSEPLFPREVDVPEVSTDADESPSAARSASEGANAGLPKDGWAGRETGVDASPSAPTAAELETASDLAGDTDTHQEGKPPVDLLHVPAPVDRERMETELSRLGGILVEKLASFGVKSEIGGRTTGPVVTQFDVVPAPGVKVNRIANLDADLALAMKARSIRIVAPIPGKGAVGVEIPNPKPEIVHLREILESAAFRSSGAALPLALGKDLSGRSYVTDLARMPHVLIAGATGSGKSVCLNTFVTSLVYSHSPESLRLLLVDPKMVELSVYADLPHLRHPVVTDPADAAGVLKWAVLEMERRYALLSANQVRSLKEFNRSVRSGAALLARAPAAGDEAGTEPYEGGILPLVVVIIDELADLMMTVQGDVERPLTLLAQKARAIGIHLVVATQRPSVNVITGLIKANFPCRIAFRVASKTDSRTILDQNGADALLGNGDMLFLPPGQGTPVRIQGAFIPGSDTIRLVDWFRQLAREHLEAGEAAPEEEDILEVVRSREGESGDKGGNGAEERDDLFFAAAEVCARQNQGSTSLLQRKLRIGYGRAARIVDQLHEAGVLGPPEGSKAREVLMGLEELDALR